MPAGKHIFKQLVKEKPVGLKYIFVTDDPFLADTLIGGTKYTVVFVSSSSVDAAFTEEEFVGIIKDFGNSCVREYFFLPVFFNAALGRSIEECFNVNYINYGADAWKIFKGRGKTLDYFRNNPDQLEPAVTRYIDSIEAKPEQDDGSPTISEQDKELNVIYKGTGYYAAGGCLYFSKGKASVMIADFVPIPKSQIFKDDGITQSMYFQIGAYKSTGFLHDVTVSAKDFPSMTWLKANWGFSANIAPSNTAKAHLEYAISSAGQSSTKRCTVYTHTGWRNINGSWVWLRSKMSEPIKS